MLAAKIGQDSDRNPVRSVPNSESDRILPEFQLDTYQNRLNFHSLAPLLIVMASEILAGVGGVTVGIVGVCGRRARGVHETAPNISKVYMCSDMLGDVICDTCAMHSAVARCRRHRSLLPPSLAVCCRWQ